jgi:hypothetical protein
MTSFKHNAALPFLLAMTTLSSCLKSSDEEVPLYPDAAVTSFTLGTMNRYIYVTRKTTGQKDSLVKTTYSGTSYSMNIDQNRGLIYNSQPLPTGTDLAHVLIKVGTKHSSVATLKSLTGDTLRYIGTGDSIDFRQPRVLRVISSDGTYRRDYTVSLNVEQEATADSAFAWSRATEWPDGLLPQADTLSAQWSYGVMADATYQLRLIKTAAPDSCLWRKITAPVGGGDWTLIPQEPENPYRLTAADVTALVVATEPGVSPLHTVAVALMADASTRVSRDEGITWVQAQGYDLPDDCTRLLRAAQQADGTVWIEDESHRLWKGGVKTDER